MKSDLFSRMQFKHYSINKLEFNALDNKEMSGEAIPEMNIDYELLKAEQGNVFLIVMDLNVNNSPKAKKRGNYCIALQLAAVYSFPGDATQAEIDQILEPGGLAMTFSLARGVVGNITAQAKHGILVLPSVNMLQIIKNRRQKKVNRLAERRKPTGKTK